jgi:serine/threonine-protein kinase
MDEPALPQLGETIGGKYRVERALGRGGMGAVFEVTHCVTNKHFAIKWLMSEPSSSNDSVTRFVREAQVAGRCEHSNIVEVYDIDRHNGQLFMVMELLKGESLAERILRCPSGMAYREACRLLVPCIEAIAEAHASGIIHRDLKPANIFLCQARGREPEFAKVLDFGVSRFVGPIGQLEVSSQTRSGAIIGTPFYMSPEQMRGHPIDARADVYSMGITLYETLTGSRPFDATSYGDLLLKVADSQATPITNIVSGIPKALCDVVACAMATNPAKRFSSMAELARALEPFAGTAVPNTPQLSWSPATQFTPLVSETPITGDLATQAGKPRGLPKAFWFGLAGVAGVGLVAWRLLGAEPDVASAVSPATSLAPIPAVPAEAPSPLPSPTTLGSSSALGALGTGTNGTTGTGTPGATPSASGAAAGGAAEPVSGRAEPNRAESSRAAESTNEASSSGERRGSYRRRRAQEQSAEPPPEEVTQQPSRREPSSRPAGKQKTRAPAHMDREDF